MPNTRKTLDEQVVQVAEKRQKRDDSMSKFIEEGWEFIKNDEKLVPIAKNWKEFSYPMPRIRLSATKYDIFMRFLPHSLLLEVLNKRVEERSQGLSLNKGNGKFYTI